MWSALENIALRESLPTPLGNGDTVHDILVAGQLDRGRYNLHHLGRRRSKPYLLKQFYSLDTDAFLRWQNEARFISLDETEGFTWPCEEWRGGLITPFPEGTPFDLWLEDAPSSLQDRLCVALQLADRIAALHASGIAHRNLSPTCIRIGEHQVTISDFGQARCGEWDDFWTDSVLTPGDMTCASPDALRGEDCGYFEDIHAFGALLHILLSGKTPFGAIKQMLRPLLPGYVPPDRLHASEVPQDIRELAIACMAHTPTDRPLMNEAASLLSRHCEHPGRNVNSIDIPHDKTAMADREKVMVFIKDDSRAAPLFEAALKRASASPSLFLFVGLIPNNLPSGHCERYKGGLFRKFGQGLMLCRGAGIPWSLRVFENTDPEQAAMNLVHEYAPDRVLLGKPDAPHDTFAARRGFEAQLASVGIDIESIE